MPMADGSLNENVHTWDHARTELAVRGLADFADGWLAALTRAASQSSFNDSQVFLAPSHCGSGLLCALTGPDDLSPGNPAPRKSPGSAPLSPVLGP
jgi:hypothetical protein